MITGRYAFGGSAINYYKYGAGDRIAFCFHGYDENATTFSFLEKYAGTDYTLIAIDLPFHGQTDWEKGRLFTATDLYHIIEGIIRKEFPAIPTESRITLLGFSLGGRVALSYYQSRPASIEQIILMAPDGLKVNFWYWLCTQSGPGNRLFAFTMRHPAWFFGFLRQLNRLKLVNASIFKFVNYYIHDPEVRELLYTRWTTLRKLKPNLSRIKSYIKEFKTPVQIVYGKHDRIMLPSVGNRFKSGIEEHCTIHNIASGHQILHEKHVRDLLPLLG